tara:strand:- start:33265 stop:33528 length:264 start_codon:yes stop_codon:yes gene_type:complete
LSHYQLCPRINTAIGANGPGDQQIDTRLIKNSKEPSKSQGMKRVRQRRYSVEQHTLQAAIVGVLTSATIRIITIVATIPRKHWSRRV